MPSSKPVRISDIATRLGVSRSLVSKVLCGHMGKSSVRPELGQRIRDCAAELGYVPNAAARALFSGRQNAVGVFLLCDDPSAESLREMLVTGVVRALSQGERHIVLHFAHDPVTFRKGIGILRQSLVDGVIVGGVDLAGVDNPIRQIAATGVPFVTAQDIPVSASIPNAGLSQRAVLQVAARHLLERGCRKPLYIHVPSEVGNLRLEGFRSVLAEAGLPCAPNQVVSMPRFFGDDAALLQTLRSAIRDGVDGIVARTDFDAALLLNGLHSAGIRVPEDVRLIGIGDLPLCQFSAVPPSSVSARDNERSVLAVRLLDELIATGSVRHLEVEPVAIVRKTT